MIEIRVLGDVEARIDGQDVDLGHARQQTVFAALLADAGRPVPVEQLITRVWGQDPPPGARSSLYSYVSRLRTALSAAGDDAQVDRRAGGYVLTLGRDAAQVDLHRFRELAGLARAAAREEVALTLLQEGIDLWRADALGGLDSPWVDEVRHSWHLDRLRAQLDRNDLLLRQGRQAERLGELISLARLHPLDERVVAQLMLTLYREGRTAQALEQYDRTRRTLSEEMGTDPGPELKDLHLRILDADPGLEAPSPEPGTTHPRPDPPQSPTLPLPSQLPARPRHLTGRENERAVLDTLHAPDTASVAVVCGLGGVGKTSLALRWAHDNLARFPDGQLYVNLHGFSPSTPAASPRTVVHDFLIALGMDAKAIPTSAEAQAGLYRSLLAGKRMLLLLDNARDAEQVRPLMPGDSSCVVLITSRDRLSGLVATEGAQSLTLGPLTSADARQLLAARLGEDRTAAEPHAVEAIVTGCGRLPLALAIAAAGAAGSPHLPLSTIASRLLEGETRLDALDTGELDTSLRSVLDASHQALPAAAARLLGLLSLAPGQDIGLPATAALAGLTVARTCALLRRLESAHLVHQPAPGRHELHDLVRLHARERAQAEIPAPERHDALRDLIGFYVQTSAVAHRLLGPYEVPSSVAEAGTPGHQPHALALTDEAAALEWFTTERAWIPAAVRLAADRGLHREVWRLCWDGHLYFRRCGHVDDFLGLGRAGLDAATRMRDADAGTLTALMRRRLAYALLLAGRPGQEPLDHLAAAVHHFEATGDHVNLAHSHEVLTLASLLAQDEDATLQHAQRALELFRSAGERQWEAAALNNLGWCLARFGQYATARHHCQAALDSSRALGYTAGEAASLDSLGYVATRAGDHAAAVDHYREALRVHQAMKDTYEEANTLSGLAEAHAALGDHDSARTAWKAALALYRAQHRTDRVTTTQARLRATP
ncbi:AfsR/SARP family transcriptional regulator [Myceligenerans salitolerans]|uniref:Tetratricopeptide repeat protein n=1 Tax=Myceligenerans salitolerans TaxID=1230528 RepID=A0ABS3IB43_9MICO|nr:BTAD domain-containing putative transcriptional regulator [Myceligenerans salitolerans]MBO0610218.1 tetratricopeptide repeat protein [Myceligenerans salitolerans]